MNCAICFESIKAEMGGKKTNFTQKCITCKDSWVCGSCYNNWDTTCPPYDECYSVMPCVFCKELMNYSKLVISFNEGTGAGWWDEPNSETKPVFNILWRIYEEENEDM
jgi:hypothetical protein